MTTNADRYFIDGYWRCKLFATPKCKVNTWKEELQHLRMILQESELTEECKWGMPCYTYNGKNIIILAAFKEFCSQKSILCLNSRAAKRIYSLFFSGQTICHAQSKN